MTASSNCVCGRTSESSSSHNSTLHQPHPNIVDELRGTIASAAAAGVVVANSNGDGSDVAASAEANSDDDDDDMITSPISLSDISEQYQIPKHIYDQHEIKQQQQQQQ